MYARIATFEGATDIKGAVAGMEQSGPPEGLKATEAYFFADAAVRQVDVRHLLRDRRGHEGR